METTQDFFSILKLDRCKHISLACKNIQYLTVDSTAADKQETSNTISKQLKRFTSCNYCNQALQTIQEYLLHAVNSSVHLTWMCKCLLKLINIYQKAFLKQLDESQVIIVAKSASNQNK